jgi:hypothetical protein
MHYHYHQTPIGTVALPFDFSDQNRSQIHRLDGCRPACDMLLKPCYGTLFCPRFGLGSLMRLCRQVVAQAVPKAK